MKSILRRKRHSYFEGWYLKHQKKGCSIAFIPAYHTDRNGKQTASIQVITDKAAYNFPFKEEEISMSEKEFCIKIGNNLFSEKGSSIDLHSDEFSVTGTLHYSSFAKLRSDIMGPFHFLPFMQCSHGVLSMIHRLRGQLRINEEEYDFSGGTGYVEKDYGSSFPRNYTWTQCSDWTGKQDCSLMVSAADIPLGPFHFKGCICAVWYQGKEYRLATYLGAVIVTDKPEELVIKQGKYKLSVKRLGGSGDAGGKESESKDDVVKLEERTDGHALRAPFKGDMSRMIKENIACKVHYCFVAGKKVVFDFISDRASYESVTEK